MGKVMFLKKGEVHTAPKKPGIELSTLAEGSIVKLNENGSPVEFYVAKHNYESALNGAGRTLLVRKDIAANNAWNHDEIIYVGSYAGGANTYGSSYIDDWLNNTYKPKLDAVVRDAIGTTRFYYTPGQGTMTVSTLSRSVFALSVAEYGLTNTNVNVEGSALPVASMLRTAYLNGVDTAHWTRSISKSSTYNAFIMFEANAYQNAFSSSRGARPAFTLPSTAVFDPETLIFKEVG